MKHFFFTLLLFLYIPIVATAAEAYAVYTNDGTLTFYYDNSKNSRSGTKYALNTGTNDPDWYTDHARDIKKAVFTSSFSAARPTSTFRWFAGAYAAKSNLSEIVGIRYLNTSNVTNMSCMFYGCNSLTNLDVTNFITMNVTSMYDMFCGCSKLTSLDVTNFNTVNVTSMGRMFCDCESLTSLDVTNFNTAKVTDMAQMFCDCESLTSLDVTNFNTAKVTSMAQMFDDCKKLTSLDVTHFNTENVKSMHSMFFRCESLTSLDVNNFNTANVTDMAGMFANCSSLISLDLSNFNTVNVEYMFWSAGGLGSFQNCINLTTIYVGEGWITDKVNKSDNMFLNCTSLVGGAGTKYDANHVDKAYAHIDGGVSNPGYLTGKGITPSMNLQEFINANAGATGVVDVDLSMFENDLVREQTLTVSTGASYRFINGKLDRASTLNAPVMSISNNSQVQVADGALITGIEHITDDTSTETIRMAGGYLIVDGGTIEGSVGGRKYTNGIIVLGNDEYDPAVRLTSNSDHFILKDGFVYGAITCDATNADIQLLAGRLCGMGQRAVDESTTQNIARRAAPMGSREPYINTRSDVYISSTTSKNYTWGYVVVIVPGGNSEESQLDPFKITLYPTSKLCLKKHYDAGFVFYIYDKQEGDVVAIGDGYTLTDADLQLMSIESNTIYYTSGPPYTDDREPYLELEDNKVYLRYKTEVVCDADDLLRYIESLTGTTTTNDDPAEATLCDEPTIDQDVDIEDDLWLYLYGDDNATPPVMNFYGGAINLKSRNSGWTFKGVGFTCKNEATAPMRAAEGLGGITSVGTLTFDGCTMKEGNYTIQNLSDGRMYLTSGTVVEGYGNLINSGNAYLDGSVKVADLANKKGGRIYVTSTLTEDIKVSISSMAEVEQDVPIILGGNGYTMTAADVSHITLSLPNGFEWKYNEAAGGIVVSTASGITAPHSTHPVAVDSYTIKGQKVTAGHQGITIQRMSDGTVVKIYSPK